MLHHRYNILVLLLSLVVLSFLVACPMGGGKDIKSFTDMTPKEKATFVMSTYTKQYDNYLALYKKDNWTDTEKSILQTKYELLGELETYIKLYNGYAENDVMAPAETEEALLAIVDRLSSL